MAKFHLRTDDAFVKSVFDFIRNLGLTALVAAATSWKLKNVAPVSDGIFAHYFDLLAVAVMVCVVLWLQIINWLNMRKRIDAEFHNKAALIFLDWFMFVCSFELAAYLAAKNAL